MESETLAPNEDQAAQLIRDAKNRRVEACASAVKAILAEHRCRLIAVPVIQQNGTIAAYPQLIAEDPTRD